MAINVCNIEVVGACNLRCPTCPNGVPALRPRQPGLMDVERFRRILEKLALECPPATISDLSLFNWGEPLLHPRIGELVRATRQAGFPCVISTNLNEARHLEQALLAAPSLLKISTSGYHQASYGRTHVGGDAARVVSNLRAVHALLRRHRLPTAVEVAYLVYRANVGDDYVRVQDLCQELGFGFRPFWALLMPIERNLDLLEGRAPAEDEALAARLVVHPRQAQAMAARVAAPARACRLLEDQLVLNPDGSVDLCCGVHRQAPVARDFLEVPLAEIQAMRRTHPFCRRCRASLMDLVITYAGGPALDALALEVLAEDRRRVKGASSHAG